MENGMCLLPSAAVRQLRQAHRHRTPAGQSDQKTIYSRLQYRRMIAKLGRFSDCLINDWVKRDNLPNEFGANGLSLAVPAQPELV
jgi:hypothetical protein